MKVQVQNRQRDVPLSGRQVRAFVISALQLLKVKTDEVSVQFVTEQQITSLHAALFNDPSPTDCITCPIDAPGESLPYALLGEIFICPSVARAYALSRGGDPIQEVLRCVVHCLLHLIGYTDGTREERAHMRRKERAILRKIQGNCTV
jgi:probable rRNA maturation factor